jgi:hypothetical protein
MHLLPVAGATPHEKSYANYSASICKGLTDEPVPKLFPYFETASFLTKCKKTGENCDFFHSN